MQSQVFLNPKYYSARQKLFNKVWLIDFDSGISIFQKRSLVSFQS